MRIVSWNVNSVRARMDHLRRVIDTHRPDLLALQETRTVDATFPYDALRSQGYDVTHHAHDHRNGVALASRVGLDDVRRGFHRRRRAPFDEPRLVSAVCGGVRIWSIYVPNGRTLDDPQYEFKLQWLDHLRADVARDVRNGVPTLLVGDFNVAPADIDIYDPSRFRRTTHASPRERAAIAALQSAGLTDVMRSLDPSPGLYTWWSYAPGQVQRNRGMRIDLALACPVVAPRVTGVAVDVATRALPVASDHAPVIVDLT